MDSGETNVKCLDITTTVSCERTGSAVSTSPHHILPPLSGAKLSVSSITIQIHYFSIFAIILSIVKIWSFESCRVLNEPFRCTYFYSLQTFCLVFLSLRDRITKDGEAVFSSCFKISHQDFTTHQEPGALRTSFLQATSSALYSRIAKNREDRMKHFIEASHLP